jgi:hypothetical protein
MVRELELEGDSVTIIVGVDFFLLVAAHVNCRC